MLAQAAVGGGGGSAFPKPYPSPRCVVASSRCAVDDADAAYGGRGGWCERGGGRGGLARRSAGGGRRWRLCMPETLPLPTLRACVASSKSLVGDDEAAAAAGLDGGEVLEVVRDACLEKAPCCEEQAACSETQQ